MQGYKVRKIELKRFYLPNQMYFITSVVENRRKVFYNEKNIKLLLDIFEYYRQKYQFKIGAFSILPDHFHWLIILGEGGTISQIMKGVQGFSARRINKENGWHGKLWQHQFLDHIIRKNEDYRNHINYIHNNPVKHKLVESPEAYRWSSYKNYYLGDDSLFKVDKL
ncbi:transposase [candidate division WOR-3 bacterium]|nr:transposase [candidate division WOR-3 bacterium]